ncbi:MAG: putative glycoside hydrolase [Patescibacteria group bacterium]
MKIQHAKIYDFFNSKLLISAFFIVIVLINIFVAISVRYSVEAQKSDIKENEFLKRKIYFNQPFYVKGIYLSSWTASEPVLLNRIIDLAKKNKLNAVVIDIKDSHGVIPYESSIEMVKILKTSESRIKNLKSILENLHKENLYVIARLPVFQDPALAAKNPSVALKNKKTGKIWMDWKGLSWVDPASSEVWDYNIALAKEAWLIGFDEINFDYIRFPSDGDISNIGYPVWDSLTPKEEVIRRFAEYQHRILSPLNITRSADLFGLTFWRDDDLNIGQNLSLLIPYFNYICPMVYPSHFPNGFENFPNPAEHPYEIIFRSLAKAKEKFIGQSALPRPWLQAFDMGAKYDSAKLAKQIKAVEDGNGYGWLLWNAKNKYDDILPR